jgi:hypothetical protein
MAFTAISGRNDKELVCVSPVVKWPKSLLKYSKYTRQKISLKIIDHEMSVN